MNRSFQHLSPFGPLRFMTGLGWRGYTRLNQVRALLPPTALAHFDHVGLRVFTRLEDIGLAGTVRTRRAEAVLAVMYQELKRLEAQVRPEVPIEGIYTRFLRNCVVDWELILLPERHRVYDLLDVVRQDPYAVIKKRYRQLARFLHPDKPYGDRERMSEINDAYEILCRMLGAD